MLVDVTPGTLLLELDEPQAATTSASVAAVAAPASNRLPTVPMSPSSGGVA
jgi:hypothetical protein